MENIKNFSCHFFILEVYCERMGIASVPFFGFLTSIWPYYLISWNLQLVANMKSSFISNWVLSFIIYVILSKVCCFKYWTHLGDLSDRYISINSNILTHDTSICTNALVRKKKRKKRKRWRQKRKEEERRWSGGGRRRKKRTRKSNDTIEAATQQQRHRDTWALICFFFF